MLLNLLRNPPMGCLDLEKSKDFVEFSYSKSYRIYKVKLKKYQNFSSLIILYYMNTFIYLQKIGKVISSRRHTSPIVSMVCLNEIGVHEWSGIDEEEFCSFYKKKIWGKGWQN